MTPTNSELLLRKAFDEIKVPVLTDQVFCFHCDNHFTWIADKCLPTSCAICRKTWQKGEVAYPDLVIQWFIFHGTGVHIRKGIIRVDGGIHQKRRQSNRDYFQVKDFRDRGLRVFIIQNEELYPKAPGVNKRIAEGICEKMAWSDEAYQKWFDSPEMQERVRKIP